MLKSIYFRIANAGATAAGVIAALALIGFVSTNSYGADAAPLGSSSQNAAALAGAQGGDAALQGGVVPDPLAPFNEAMFTFNLKLDDYVLHPAASGYAKIAPVPVREAVGRFFDNVLVIPRFANNLLQLRVPEAGGEVARFGINTTVGVLGFFDPAEKWFGLHEHDDDFGLTIRYYNIPTGPYLVLPFFGPSTIGDTVGLITDGAMDPLAYFVPWWISLSRGAGQRIAQAINYRSLHLNMFEEADRYAVDLYGAVQDAYTQTRANRVKALKTSE
ncbi:MAG TPA: VacJ family lipoprotein [Candidatus Binataceae bacterium]|nr:VacJ family lipoprotein [Candidatus Binataceae bacterium]